MENEGRTLVFGKYEMGRLLGQGTFGKVYYAKHFISGESVAIKVLNIDRVKKEGLMDQIKREISVMGLLKHPNIVQLKEVMASKSKIYFVMEHVRGGELFAKVAKGKLKEDIARKYFQQLISAVDFCHSRGVSHRDLKPENLLLDENEDLKISDFGLSALPEQLWQDGLLHTQCGTPAYVAPEVLRKKGYDGTKADIWSCGVILYVLLAGFLPFQDENLMNMYRKVFKAQFHFPQWFSPDAKRMVTKLLVTNPEKRLTIARIIEVPWFKKGFKRPQEFTEEQEKPIEEKWSEERMVVSKDDHQPSLLNAFQLISSMSSGFDLSGLFEKKKKAASVFTSRCSASAILAKLESMGKGLSFKVLKMRDFKVKLERVVEGRKGKLGVTAEIFQVAPSVALVEFCKSAGDTLEYRDFFERDVRPGLKDVVWVWQGDIDHNNVNA